ncbi:FCS-Like Zinc finger 10-like protein [Drosera capensis]
MQASGLRTMLRKRNRSTQRDQQMDHRTSEHGSDGWLQSGVAGQKQKGSSFFNLPGLFIGLAPKGVSDCDSVRSPTSPLDFKLLSDRGNSFRASRCSNEGNQKSWDSNKVGLGIVDSLGDDVGKMCGKVVAVTNTKSIIFGPQITKTSNPTTQYGSSESPKSLPMNCDVFPHALFKSSNRPMGSSDVLFEIGDDPIEPYPFSKLCSFSLDSSSSRNSGLGNGSSGREDSPPGLIVGSPKEDISVKKLGSSPVVVGSENGLVGYLSLTDIELSEDYTCVISHGPNPKTTHIFGDFILECHAGEAELQNRRGQMETGSPKLGNYCKFPGLYPSDDDDFLSFCCFCKKQLGEGKDIYMYRGERAFCSTDCRLKEILIEEGKEKSISEASKESSRPPIQGEDNFENSMFDAI